MSSSKVGDSYRMDNYRPANNDDTDEDPAAAEIKEEEKKKKRVFIMAGIIALFFVLVVIVAVVIVILCGDGKEDCSQDGFEFVAYNITGGGGESRYLKYKAFEKPSYSLYNFSEAKQKCLDVEGGGAALWEVLDGKPEWEAIYPKLKAERKDPVWLNGVTTELCGGDQEAAQCNQEEAKEGRGLGMKWPSTGEQATYSRLIGGVARGCIRASKDQVKIQSSNLKG